MVPYLQGLHYYWPSKQGHHCTLLYLAEFLGVSQILDQICEPSVSAKQVDLRSLPTFLITWGEFLALKLLRVDSKTNVVQN